MVFPYCANQLVKVLSKSIPTKQRNPKFQNQLPPNSFSNKIEKYFSKVNIKSIATTSKKLKDLINNKTK